MKNMDRTIQDNPQEFNAKEYNCDCCGRKIEGTICWLGFKHKDNFDMFYVYCSKFCREVSKLRGL
jgi:hypothetical protein